MATSDRRVILEAIVARLAAIQTRDGFETDAGDDVAIGDALELGPNDPDMQLLVVPGDATKRSDGKKKFVDFAIEIQALVKVGLTDAWVRVEAMVSDIERAIEAEERRTITDRRYPLEWMGTRTLQRQPGSETAGVGITYSTTYGQAWGAP